MKTPNWFKIWRRKPFKEALCQAYSEGIINSKQLHILAWKFDNLDKNLVRSLGAKPPFEL
jgi:hypothetical protein